MNIKHLTLGVLIHLAATVIFMFLSIGASLGLGFKENLSLPEQAYVQFCFWGMAIFRGLLNIFGEQLLLLPGEIQVLAVIFNSVLTVWLLLWMHRKMFRRSAM